MYIHDFKKIFVRPTQKHVLPVNHYVRTEIRIVFTCLVVDAVVIVYGSSPSSRLDSVLGQIRPSRLVNITGGCEGESK